MSDPGEKSRFAQQMLAESALSDALRGVLEALLAGRSSSLSRSKKCGHR